MITAAWRTADAAAEVTVTGVPDGPVALIRADANGSAAVRGVPDAIAGTATVIDAEPALRGPVTYSVAGAGTAELAAFTGPAGLYVAAVGQPGTLTRLTLITDDSMSRTAATTVHPILDSAEPVAVIRPLQLRAGTLELLAADPATAAELAAIPDAVTLLARATDTAGPVTDGYLAVTETRAAAETSGRYAVGSWRVSWDYQTVAAPAGAGSGVWSYADVAQTFTDYAGQLVMLPTYRDLYLGSAR